jgi:hypothetical protein
MSFLADRTGTLDRISLSSRQQQAFRAAALVSGALFLCLVPVAGGGFHPLLSAIGGVVLLVTVQVPESNAPLGLLLYLGGLWVVTVPRSSGVEVLLAAVLLGALHLACLLASYGPPGLVLDRSFVRLWRRRFGLCVGAAVLVWLLTGALDFLDLPASPPALGVALALVLAWVAVLTARLTPRPTGDRP